MENKHTVFSRLVGRVMGALDMAKVDENVKKAVKAYIWQAEKDVQENCQKWGVDNGTKKM